MKGSDHPESIRKASEFNGFLKVEDVFVWQTRKRDLLLEEGRLTYKGYLSWKRKLKLKWLQREGGVTIEKKVESSNSSGIGGTRDPGGVRGQKHSQC